MPDFPTQRYIDPVIAEKQNVLKAICEYGKWGGNSIGPSFEKDRLNRINRDLFNAGISSERVVHDVQSVISKKSLRVLECGALHESPGNATCFGLSNFYNNLGCLHVGDEQLRISTCALNAWGLLPMPASVMHKRNLNRSKQISLFDSQYPEPLPNGRTSLDQVAAILWNDYNRDPRTVPWWNERQHQLVQFREGIRDALLKVHAHTNIRERLSYIRDALRLSMHRPKRISTAEFRQGMNEAGIPVTEATQFRYRMADD